MRETQGKVEASKDTVKELNKQLEPVEVQCNHGTEESSRLFTVPFFPVRL